MKRTLYIPDHLFQFAAASGNASGYIQELIEQRIDDWIKAKETISRFPRPAVMAVMDVLNGHLFTEGLSAAKEITINLEDAGAVDGLQKKWGINDDTWSELLEMSDSDGEAFRTIAREFWAGRQLDS